MLLDDDLRRVTGGLGPEVGGLALTQRAHTLRDGGGTFTLQAPALNIGPKVLPARLTGTQVGGDWRIGGFLGQSSFTGGLSGGEVFGQGDLRALPLGAVVAASVVPRDRQASAVATMFMGLTIANIGGVPAATASSSADIASRPASRASGVASPSSARSSAVRAKA